jgi:hypothetical protein
MPVLKANSRSCRPPVGKTYLTIGQDFFSIQEYVQSQYNASLHRSIHQQSLPIPLKDFAPAALMTYTDIQQLKGLATPVDYGSGMEYAKGLAEAFPGSGLQIGLWLNGTAGCSDILNGTLDQRIIQLYDVIGHQLHSTTADTPKVFLRVGYEFDNPWFGYSEDPSTYQRAFQKMVTDCENQLGFSVCHDRIAFVWHSWAAPRSIASLDTFYPGDEFVDWVGISIFQQLYPWANLEGTGAREKGNFAGGDLTHVIEVLEYAKSHDKPVMIAESTPFGGMHVASTDVALGFIDDSATDAQNGDILWDLWFQKTIDLIDRYDIAMWSYINCDWESQPMWHNIGFGDTRLSSSKLVMENWWVKVLRNDTRFVARMDCSSQLHAQKHLFSKLLKADARLSIGSFSDKTTKNCTFLFGPLWQCLCIVSVMVVPVLAYVQRKQRGGQVEENLRIWSEAGSYRSL